MELEPDKLPYFSGAGGITVVGFVDRFLDRFVDRFVAMDKFVAVGRFEDNLVVDLPGRKGKVGKRVKRTR